MLRRKQASRFKTFYYSHPYFVIFNVLIVYNIILVGLAALVMTYLMDGIGDSNGFVMAINWDSYLRNLEYCAVFTMNNGGIYNQAPTSVIIMKIVLSIFRRARGLRRARRAGVRRSTAPPGGRGDNTSHRVRARRRTPRRVRGNTSWSGRDWSGSSCPG